MKRSKNMSIADEQKRMSHTLAMIGFGEPWSVNDEIDYRYAYDVVPCIPSRNQREGYFDGKYRGTYKFMRVKYKINRVKIS